MYKNGISHLTAASDLDGALQIINYLMFIPGELVCHDTVDSG